MPTLYNVPLPDAQSTDPPSESIQSAVATQGLVADRDGVETQQIATETVDLQLTGQFRLGATLSQKLADELESLAESSYSGLPFYALEDDDLGRKKGYYELEAVDVEPAHEATRDTFRYAIGLAAKGTHETHWRAVRTAVEDIETGLATGDGGRIAIPQQARKVRWFDTGDGKETANSVGTADAEFGTLELYDPADASVDDPTLIYEVDFDEEHAVDVRVFDDRDLEKFLTVEGDGGGGTWGTGTWGSGTWAGTQRARANQWTHVYHTAFEFDGRPLIDNGLVRLRIDESAATIDAYEWLDDVGEWSSIDAFTLDGYSLLDADIERISPTTVDVFAEFEADDGSLEAAILSVQRGIDAVVVRNSVNGTLSSDLEDELEEIASDQTTDPQPAQQLRSRQETK